MLFSGKPRNDGAFVITWLYSAKSGLHFEKKIESPALNLNFKIFLEIFKFEPFLKFK